MPIVDDRCCATLPSVEVMCLDVAVVTHDVMRTQVGFVLLRFLTVICTPLRRRPSPTNEVT